MINEKLDVALAAVKEIQTLKEQVSELQTKNNHFEESLKFAYDEIQDLKSNVADLRETTSIQQQDIFALIDDLGAEKARGVKLESHSRRNNLRFFNIAEQANESYQDAEQALRKFLENDLGGGHDFATNISIERVHRTTAAKPPTTMKPRPIIAKFSYFKEKERIRMMAKNLKGTTFGIAEDYAPEVLEVRKKLVQVMKKAHTERKKAFIKYDQLFIEGNLYKGPEAYKPYAFSKRIN